MKMERPRGSRKGWSEPYGGEQSPLRGKGLYLFRGGWG